jgi:hypothetical protein
MVDACSFRNFGMSISVTTLSNCSKNDSDEGGVFEVFNVDLLSSLTDADNDGEVFLL